MIAKISQAAIDMAVGDGASYADIRIVLSRKEEICVRNGELVDLSREETLGAGIRVVADGAWGFAYTNRVDKKDLVASARLAVRIAKASGKLRKKPVRLASEPAVRDSWATPCLVDPFSVDLAEKLDLLYQIDAILRKKRQVAVAEGNMSFWKERSWLRSSEGTEIDQTLVRSGVGYQATAVGQGDSQVRSYPNSFRGMFQGGGYELILALPLVANAPRVRDEAIQLLSADPCPETRTNLILDGSQLSLQIHESVGHATELDRVLGMEESYAGSSFVTTEKLGSFVYGSPIVNLVADSTLPGGLATAGYDDDGVAAQRFDVVREGIFKGYLTSRELAHTIKEKRSRGCCRADGYETIPILRIPNLSLLPGKVSYEDLIASTKKGVLMETNRCWSIDQRRLNFQFGCEIAFEIRNGKRTRMLKNASYQGVTPKFWRSCDAIGDAASWQLWGVPTCGKGQPVQTAEMTHGASPARFRNVRVGVGSGRQPALV